VRARHGLIAAVFAGLLVSAVALGQVRSTSDDVIGVEEITPGMTGYGLTVLRGTQPERFDVEVIDVLHGFRPDQDLILIRTPHELLDRAHVVAGMSGSPIYLDGRLAGAYAYGWPFSADPVAGVTPIRNMLSELRRPVRPDPFDAPLRPERASRRVRGPHLAGLPAYRGQRDVTPTTALEAHAERVGTVATPSGTTLTPAATPLMLGGFDESVVRMLDAQLSPFGMVTLQVGGTGQATPPPNTPTAYVDGGAVGIQIVRGDISSTAVGTVTHVEGDRAVAFGHPMISAGQTSLPATLVRVLHVLVSINRSFKISEPTRALGTLIHDRQSGVVVDSANEAEVVPCTVRIRGAEGAPRTEWNFEVASHRVLTPVILNAAILNAVKATAADNADVTYTATSQVWVTGRGEPERVVDHGYSRIGAASPASLRQLRLYDLLEAVYGNPFEEARATRVEVELDLRYERDTVRVVNAFAPGDEVNPGETVPLRVVLRRFGQDEEVRVVPVRIPERYAGETIRVDIEPGGGVDIHHAQARSLEDLLGAVQEAYPSTSMVISMRTPQRGLRFPGHVVRHLPPSALDTLQLTNDADRARPFITYDRHEVGLDRVVAGGARVELTVRSTPRD